MSRKSPTVRFALIAAVAILVLSLVPVASGGKNAGATTTQSTLTASPNPVQSGSSYSVSGCGYVVGKQVNIVINKGMFFGASPNADGCIASSWWAGSPGSYTIEAYQNLKGRRQTLMAATTLTVVA